MATVPLATNPDYTVVPTLLRWSLKDTVLEDNPQRNDQGEAWAWHQRTVPKMTKKHRKF